MKFDKRYIKMKKLFTLIAAASLMAACSEEVTTNRSEGDKQYISFSVSDTQNSSTRAFVAPWYNEQTEVTDAEKCVVAVDTDLPTEYPLCLTITDEPFIHRTESDLTRGAILNSGDAASLEFGVTEFLKDGDTEYFSNTKPAYQNVTLDGGRELFKANEFWEYDSYDGMEYDFYAYAPHVNSTGQGITLSNHNRTITYDATGISVGSQPDLMTARKWTSSYVGAIPLNFQHRLCAIQIKTAGAWASGIHVSAVKFLNVISSGTFNIDTDKDDAWTSKGAAGDYVVSGFNEAAATATVVTGPTDKWLMMVPQTLSGAKLSITLTDGSSNSTILTAPINSTAWSAGHTVTYTISPEAISEITVNYPTGSARSWNDGGNPEQGPISTYNDDDHFGLFVVDKDNKIIISNQDVTPTTGADAASRTLDISFFKSKQYRYFLMYPYKDNATLQSIVGLDNYNNYYKEGATGRSASADAFFAEVISNWSPVNNQSAEATFKSQDLQIAALSGDHFDMVHKMGLLACTLPDGITSNDVITYDGNTYDSSAEGEKWTKIDSKCTTMEWNASTTFTSTDKPYISGTTLYYITKPGNATIAISASSSTGYYDWSVSGASTTVSTANAYKTFTIASPDLSNYYNQKVWEFSYVGEGKQWKVPFDGTYRMECWGASGGGGPTIGTSCCGGYVSGVISLTKDQDFYIYTGQHGNSSNNASSTYMFNGGGYAVVKSGHCGACGGGATDVRTVDGDWDNTSSLNSRIIIAAGGGGGAAMQTSANAGGLDGYNGIGGDGTSYNSYQGKGASQSGGGSGGPQFASARAGTAGTLGKGGLGGYNHNNGAGGGGGSGGGGGLYGGGGSSGLYNGLWSGGGGSSYISGHSGCTAKTLTFSSTVMIDGMGYEWTPTKGSQVGIPTPADGNVRQNGYVGDGICHITYTRP